MVHHLLYNGTSSDKLCYCSTVPIEVNREKCACNDDRYKCADRRGINDGKLFLSVFNDNKEPLRKKLTKMFKKTIKKYQVTDFHLRRAGGVGPERSLLLVPCLPATASCGPSIYEKKRDWDSGSGKS